MRTLFAVLLLLAARTPVAQPVHYLSLVNNASADVEAIELVPTDNPTNTIVRHDLLIGGGTATLSISDTGECRRDLRLTFAGNRHLTIHRLDICRDRTLHMREFYLAVLRERDAVAGSAYVLSTTYGNSGRW